MGAFSTGCAAIYTFTRLPNARIVAPLPHRSQHRMRTASFLLALALATPATAKDIVVHAGTLLDGVSATARHDVSILIKDDRIIGIQPGYASPAGAEVIDLTHQTVMPGFI